MRRRSATRRRPGPGSAQRAAAGALACLLATAPQAGLAGPALDGDHPDVALEATGALTTITAGDGSVGNYTTFDIAVEETVDVQIDNGGRHLARISGPETRIDGTLLSNGHVYLLNPAGILFGAGAQVNVAGLHAAAGNITDEEFQNPVACGESGEVCDQYTGIEGGVTNLGAINAEVVNLIGRFVSNEGTISGMKGMFALVAGDDVLIGRTGDELLVRIEGAGSDVVDIFEGDYRVTTSGTLDAGAEGRVFLGAGDLHGMAIHHTSAAQTTAGELVVEAGAVDDDDGDGDVLLRGLISADDIRAETPGELDVQTDLTASASIDLHAGTDGVGLLTIENVAVASESIALAAGDGFSSFNPGRLGNARVDLGGSTFRSAADPDAAPGTFSLTQDADLTNSRIPSADAFGGSVAGMQYALESSDGDVVLEDSSKFAGSALAVQTPTQVLIDADLELESLFVGRCATVGLGCASVRAESLKTTGSSQFQGIVELQGDADQLIEAGGQLVFDDLVQKVTTGTLTLAGEGPADPDDPDALRGGIRLGRDVVVGLERAASSTGGTLVLDADETVLVGSLPTAEGEPDPLNQELVALTEFEIPTGAAIPEFGRPGAIEARGIVRKETSGDLRIETESLRAEEVSVERGELRVVSRLGLDVQSDLTVLDPAERLLVQAGIGVSADLEFSGTEAHTLTAREIELGARPGRSSNAGNEGISRVILGETRFRGVDADGNIGGNPDSVRIHQDAPLSGSDLPAQDRWEAGSVAGVRLELESNGGTRTLEPENEGEEPEEIVTVGSITLDPTAAQRTEGSELLAEAEVITIAADLSGIGLDLRSEQDLDVRDRTLAARSINLSAGNREGSAQVLFDGASFQGQDAENPLSSFALRQDGSIDVSDVPAVQFPDGGADLEFFGLESLAESITVNQDLADLISGDDRTISLRAGKNIRVGGDLQARELEVIAKTLGSTPEAERDPEVDVGLLIETRNDAGELQTTALSADVMTLRAGDRNSQTGDAQGDERVTFSDVVIRGLTRDSPTEFTLRQDARLEADALPGASENVRFGGDVTGMAYTLRSDAGTLSIRESATLDGTALTLAGVAVNVDRDHLRVFSLDASNAGQVTLSGDVTATGLTSDPEGNRLGSIVLPGTELDGDGDVQRILSRGGDVRVEGPLSRPAGSIEIVARRGDVLLEDVVTEGDAGDAGGSLRIEAAGNVSLGFVSTEGVAGGDVTATAGGDLVVTGGILTQSTLTQSDPESDETFAPNGGAVALTGANVSVQEIVTVAAAPPPQDPEAETPEATSGDVTITATAGDGEISLGFSVVAARLEVPDAAGDIRIEGDRITLDPSPDLEDSNNTGLPELVLQGKAIVIGGDVRPVTEIVSGPDGEDVELDAPIEFLVRGSDAVTATGDISASQILMTAGGGGTGDLVLAGPPGQKLMADTIELAAASGGDSSRVELGEAEFFGLTDLEGEPTAPRLFALVQEASLTDADLPSTDRFGGPIEGMIYHIAALGGSIDLAETSRVEGTNLILAAPTPEGGGPQVRIGGETGEPLRVASFQTCVLAGGGLCDGVTPIDAVVTGDFDAGASSGLSVFLQGDLRVEGAASFEGDVLASGSLIFGRGVALTGSSAQTLEAAGGELDLGPADLEKSEGDLTLRSRDGVIAARLTDDGNILEAGRIDVAAGSLEIQGDFVAEGVSSAGDLLLRGQGTLSEEGDTVLRPDGDLVSQGIEKTARGDLVLGVAEILDEETGELVPAGTMLLSGRMSTAGSWVAETAFTSDADLEIVAGEQARFLGDVSSGASVDVTATGQVLFGDLDEPGQVARALTAESIRLGVREPGPLVPSIASDGPLTLEATGGDVRIAPSSKLGAAGDVSITATGTVQLSDVTATALTVDAAAIEVNGRAPAASFDIDGNLVQDRGVDFVANRILFSSQPTLLAGGEMTFGTPTGTEVSEQVARGGGVRAIGTSLRFVPPSGGLADLTPIGPARFDAANQSNVEMADTANATSETIVMVRARANTVASDSRPLWANELLAYLDADLLAEPPVERRKDDARLETEAVRRAAHQYETLFRPRQLRDSRGERVYDSLSPRIRETLERAVAAYRAAHGDAAPDGEAFLAFVEQDEAQFEALDYLQRAAELIRSVRRLDMERAELETVEDALLGRLETDALPARELRAAMQELLERPSASTARDPSQGT